MTENGQTPVLSTPTSEFIGRCAYCGSEDARMMRGPSIDKMFTGDQSEYILLALKLTGLFDEKENAPVLRAHVCVCENCIHELSAMFMSADIQMQAEEWSERKVRVSPEIIFAMLSESVIGQERAKRSLAVAVWEHYARLRSIDLECAKSMPYPEVDLEKTNIMLIGPTGSGKTLLVKTIANYLDVPFVTFDASSITATGYKGKDADDCLVQLILNAEGDLEAAEQGIVYLDEIDKIIAKEVTGSLDIGGVGAQQALLKLIEGAEVPVEMMGKDGKKEIITINTQNILFIASGAFPGLAKIIEKRTVKKGLGFASVGQKVTKVTEFDKVTTEDLTAYGFIAEFSGRFPVISTLDSLTREDMMRVLVEPRNSVLNQYKKLFALDGVGFNIADDALAIIVNEAMTKKTGARGLRSSLEKRLENLLFSFPEMKRRQPRLVRITIDASYFSGGEPKYEFRKPRLALSCKESEAEG